MAEPLDPNVRAIVRIMARMILRRIRDERSPEMKRPQSSAELPSGRMFDAFSEGENGDGDHNPQR
jgi:hypothetical protein